MFVAPKSCSTENTRGRSRSKGSGRPEQSADGAGVKSPPGSDRNCPCAEEFGNIGRIAEQTSTRTDLRHSTGGVGFQPQSPLQLDSKLFAKCLREAPSGSSPGPRGCTNEMLRLCLEDKICFSCRTQPVRDFASGAVPSRPSRPSPPSPPPPHTVGRALMLATIDCYRGKRTEGSGRLRLAWRSRRLVAKCLARHILHFSSSV